MQPKLLSCKAKVAEVIDDEAGIYLLSNHMKLYITFLKDLTGELWNGENPSKTFVEVTDDHPSLETSCTSHTSRNTDFYKCLRVGDTIKILKCHYILEEKKVTLVCCGQSRILNESRKLVLNTHTREQASWVTDAVHSLNLNFKGLTWLLRLKEELLSILSSSVSTSAYYSSQTPNGESDILIQLLNEAKRRNMVKESKPHSPGEEFHQAVHDCGLMQDFVPPFELTSLKNIFYEQAQNTFWTASNQDQEIGDSSDNFSQRSSQLSDFWSYFVSPEGKYPAVLVGKLGGGQDGVLQLIQTEVTMDLVIIGNAGMALSKFGTIVALFNYHIVKEKFHIIEEDVTDVHKLYIVVQDADLVVLEPNKELSLLKEKNSKRYFYKMKLLSKSALVVPHFKEGNFSLSQFLHNKFFVGMTTIMKIGCKGEVLEMWQKFVKFSGENADLYPLLEVGDECELRVPPLFNAEIALKRSQTFHWMKCISEDHSTECLFLPPEILLMKVSSVKMKWGEVSVQQVQSEGHQSELITITGFVMCKTFVTPKFHSEITTLPHNICKDSHIGVPQSMQFRLLIRDENDCDSEVWLYMTCTTKYFTKIYPLFVIPGVRIIATDMKRMVAKISKNVYLTSSNFTHIIPISIPESEKPHIIDKLTFMEPMYLTLRNVPLPSDTFIIFARVNKIMRAALKVVCNICNYDMEQYSYCCGNCFAQFSANLEASVEVAVDDGTNTTHILLKDVKHFVVLLRLSRKDFTKLSNFVLSQCLHLNYATLQQQCSQTGSLKYGNSKDFRMMITKAKLSHSYKFVCRRQNSQPHLCLDMSLLRPTEDIKLLQ